MSTLLLKPAEAAAELRISTREFYYLAKSHPEIVTEIPGVRGVRVNRQRLAEFVERLNPVPSAENRKGGLSQ